MALAGNPSARVNRHGAVEGRIKISRNGKIVGNISFLKNS